MVDRLKELITGDPLKWIIDNDLLNQKAARDMLILNDLNKYIESGVQHKVAFIDIAEKYHVSTHTVKYLYYND